MVCSHCKACWPLGQTKPQSLSGSLESDDGPRLDPKLLARIERLESSAHTHKVTTLTNADNNDTMTTMGLPEPVLLPEGADMSGQDVVDWVKSVEGSFADPNDKPIDCVGVRCPTCRNPPYVFGGLCADAWHVEQLKDNPEPSMLHRQAQTIKELQAGNEQNRKLNIILGKNANEALDRAIKAEKRVVELEAQLTECVIATGYVEKGVNLTPAGLAGAAQAVRDKIKDQITLTAERDACDDMRRKAQQRAVERWHIATGKEMTIPDHADLCVWLFEQLDKKHQDWNTALRLRDAAYTREARLLASIKKLRVIVEDVEGGV